MAVKTTNSVVSKRFSDLLKALEERIRIYIWKIHSLQEAKAELEKTVAELESENLQLKRELESFTGKKS